jgi:hypothetical protein
MQRANFSAISKGHVAKLLLAFVVLSGCSVAPQEQRAVNTQYKAAIADAAVATPDGIKKLRALPVGDSVIVVTWASASKQFCGDGATQCQAPAPVWVSLPDELQPICRKWRLSGVALRERLEQLLGLPPDSPQPYRKAKFVVLAVAPVSVVRPCLGVALDGSPECTLRENGSQKQDVVHIVNEQMASAYEIDKKSPGYPFTRLGYTYDWSSVDTPSGHYGVSEFVVLPGANISVLDSIPTDAYCSSGPT